MYMITWATQSYIILTIVTLFSPLFPLSSLRTKTAQYDHPVKHLIEENLPFPSKDSLVAANPYMYAGRFCKLFQNHLKRNMKRIFHDFLTLLKSTEKLLTRAGFELAPLRFSLHVVY